MTLTDLLPVVQALSVADKLALIRILTAELEPDDNISPLEPFKTYHLPTPYNSFGAGAALMEAMKQSQ